MEVLSILSILAITIAGAYVPLFSRRIASQEAELPRSESFAAGVFLALCFVMMLPSASHLMSVDFPQALMPIGPLVIAAVFIVLLGIRQYLHSRGDDNSGVVAILMTAGIAVPSFFLGAALGVSASEAAVLILIAILAHKGSAAFALSLQLTRSALARSTVLIVFFCFALSTPVGILVGEQVVAVFDAGTIALIKGVVLSIAAGTFLFMASLHDLQHSPLITACRHLPNFLWMVAGFVLTACVKLILGAAHHL